MASMVYGRYGGCSPFNLDGKRMTWSYARSPRWNSDNDSLFGVSNDSLNPLPAARNWLARLSQWDQWRGERTLEISQELGIARLLSDIVENNKQPVAGGANG